MKSTLKLSIATLAVVFGMLASASASSSTFFFKYFSTGGSIYPWYSNDNSWGYSNTSGSGFMEMVIGEDWGNISPYHPIPKKISSCGPCTEYFSSYHGVNSGGRIDTTWDNFVDTAVVSNRQGTEIMIWLNWQGTQPICGQYNAQGQAVPTYTNVNIGGWNYNVFTYHWSSGYWTLTFEVAGSQTGSATLGTRYFLDWAISKGYFNSSWYYMEVGAGWEYANGWATCNGLSHSGTW
ncbi:MAG: cellulase B precursor [Verrucomicrobiia bacterium]|jgi:hypothetical protein